MSTSSTYVFRIMTKSGSITGNLVYQGTSQYDAERKLKQQFPDCTILDVQVRQINVLASMSNNDQLLLDIFKVMYSEHSSKSRCHQSMSIKSKWGNDVSALNSALNSLIASGYLEDRTRLTGSYCLTDAGLQLMGIA